MDPEFDFDESDIVDQHCQPETERGRLSESDIPMRPTSRLSFNRVTIDSPPLTEEETTALHLSISGTAHRSRGLLRFSKIDVTAMDIAEVSNDHLLELDRASSHYGGDNANSSRDENEDEDTDTEFDHCYSSSEASDEEDAGDFPLPPQFSEPNAFSIPPDEDAWVTRPKFSCLPSPLSPYHRHEPSFSFRYVPHRHGYRQHGFSRHALLHLKWFWAIREDEWVARTTRQRSSKAYGGLSIFRDVAASNALRLPGCRLSDRSGLTQTISSAPLPPMSIHPRRGDISALKDPFCMHIDRFFVGLPLWTMSKMLWMHDVHVGSESRARETVGHNLTRCNVVAIAEELLEEERSEGDSIETSISEGSSDDSDATLVDSEGEENVLGCADSSDYNAMEDGVGSVTDAGIAVVDVHLCADPRLPMQGCTSSKVSLIPNREAHSSWSRGQTQDSSYRSAESQNLMRPCSSWVTCWYQRWDILAELVRNDREASMDHSDDSSSPHPSANAKSAKFYFADDESWNDLLSLNDETYYDDDTEDVVMTINPSYKNGTEIQPPYTQV